MWNSEAQALGFLLGAPIVSACSKAHAGARTERLSHGELFERTGKCARRPREVGRSLPPDCCFTTQLACRTAGLQRDLLLLLCLVSFTARTTAAALCFTVLSPSCYF